MSDDSDETRKKIQILNERKSDLNSGLGLYPNIIDRLKYQSTPERITQLKSHYSKMETEYKHIDFKKSSDKCLGCDKLFQCPKKCEDKFN